MSVCHKCTRFNCLPLSTSPRACVTPSPPPPSPETPIAVILSLCVCSRRPMTPRRRRVRLLPAVPQLPSAAETGDTSAHVPPSTGEETPKVSPQESPSSLPLLPPGARLSSLFAYKAAHSRRRCALVVCRQDIRGANGCGFWGRRCWWDSADRVGRSVVRAGRRVGGRAVVWSFLPPLPSRLPC